MAEGRNITEHTALVMTGFDFMDWMYIISYCRCDLQASKIDYHLS